MNERLRDVLEGTNANYIMPLFWLKGESAERIQEEIKRVHESGIGEIIIEARPHPDFLGPTWWQLVDVVIEAAKARGMRVWAFDDDHFPTGHVAGKLADGPPELRRLFLSERHIDAIGPAPSVRFHVGTPYAVIVAKRDSTTGELTGETYDVTDSVRDGYYYGDIAEGYWRVFVFDETDQGANPHTKDHFNPLNPRSVRLLIDTVYEAFYERYASEFGGTFAGFFSDEPGFYNDQETYDYQSTIGKPDVPLPWSRELASALEEELGSGYPGSLPLLFCSGETRQTALVRYRYMNLVSKLYGKHFTDQIGEWCRERGVEYIGHVLEDNNVHARLGPGAGHFFRALWGQDMSGIDVVLWQLSPGYDELPFRSVVGETDSEFFNYGLAKMAASLGHIDPKKKGRTMAEVFGAYGWAEGLKLMKWMTDHMLVRGVNHFVPHAFSAKDFPDEDCPPHMYAQGMNPQYRYYKLLNDYTNRICHLLTGGTHRATAAVLYHAEAEWSGSYQYFHKPVKELMRRQIDCDIIPCDTLIGGAAVVEGSKLHSHGETFDCFIVPFSEALPEQAILRLGELAEQGLPIYFIDGFPSRASEGTDIGGAIGDLSMSANVQVVTLDCLADALRASGHYELESANDEPYLRNYHVSHEGLDVYLLVNEHPLRAIDTNLYLPFTQRAVYYDAFKHTVTDAGAMSEDGRMRLHLRLAPYESAVVLAGPDALHMDSLRAPRSIGGELKIDAPWEIGLASAEHYPAFESWGVLEQLADLSHPDRLPDFSGTFRYEARFEWREDAKARAYLDLGSVFETAEVMVNGTTAGVCICPPYRYEIGGLLKPGMNALTIEVTNTLARAQQDMFSKCVQQDPSGLLGPVKIVY